MKRFAVNVIVGVLALLGWAAMSAWGAEEYKLGVSAAITGPVAGTYAPTYEGLKIYLDRLNERGGVNGRKVEAIYLDNRAAPQRVVTDVKRFVEDEKVTAMINISTSATYAPMVAGAKAVGVPLIFLGSAVCPQEVYPPKPDPYLFCTSFNMLGPDSAAIAHFIETLSGGKNVKAGLVAMDIPISRQGVDLIEKLLLRSGLEVVGKVAVPAGTADLAPFATRFANAKANWVSHWAPFELAVAMFTSLTKLGWSGNYLATASAMAESGTATFRQPNFYVMPTYSFTVEKLPAFKLIAEAATKYKASYPVESLTLGWVGGMVVEEALKGCGWPCSTEKLRGVLENLKVDTQGLYGGPLDWSPENHVRSAAYYRIYRWDPAQERIVRVKDWLKIPIK
jgi:ABC-type branched-subunit amino acid transport system substrate-binding protein